MSTDPSASPAAATTLAATRRGRGPRVTLVHGFAQTGACLGPLADDLARDHEVVLPDAPGHGASERHARADLAAGASLLAATAAGGVLLGYSMGGRLALRAALDHPGSWDALVLVGATAGLRDRAERDARAAADAALADRIEQQGVDAFLEEWLALPLFAGLPEWARFERERARNSAEGLADSLRHSGTGVMEPVWERLGRLALPVLLVTGGADTRFGAVADEMARAIGRGASHVVVDGAGHAAHLERADAVTAHVRTLLDRLGR